MAKYRINISYRTGGSFGNSDENQLLELSWSDLDVAKENLLRIQEHYTMYRSINDSYSKKSKETEFTENIDKPWFVFVPKLFCISSNRAIDEKDKEKVGEGDWEYRPDDYYAENCLNLKTDSGNEMQMTAFWCGYFESLYSAEIIPDRSDMKITF
jgi:hypothetical protein